VTSDAALAAAATSAVVPVLLVFLLPQLFLPVQPKHTQWFDGCCFCLHVF